MTETDKRHYNRYEWFGRTLRRRDKNAGGHPKGGPAFLSAIEVRQQEGRSVGKGMNMILRLVVGMLPAGQSVL